MGRMAAHTGQLVTFSDMLECKTEFARRGQADLATRRPDS